MFDVTMGSFDGAEICELVGLLLLNDLSKKFGKKFIGLYHHDGQAAGTTFVLMMYIHFVISSSKVQCAS